MIVPAVLIKSLSVLCALKCQEAEAVSLAGSPGLLIPDLDRVDVQLATFMSAHLHISRDPARYDYEPSAAGHSLVSLVQFIFQ